jgi:hypothetical protein
MKTKVNSSPDTIKNEIRSCLEGKSIYEMTVWTRDHAQHLKWFCNYNSSKIDSRIQPVINFSFFLYNHFNDDPIVIDEFRELCVACVIDLETNCR